jgi:hypothetical protein
LKQQKSNRKTTHTDTHIKNPLIQNTNQHIPKENLKKEKKRKQNTESKQNCNVIRATQII